ncbi:YdeI/OmpD-associated family protein [Synoicihabitans lomoniglobus]|uniref:YdeI/OmpD-associated family protein n=1 Tax=Synoicihabitans lomoniglobus TaxID=2909285 RepID=A0AAE9ZVK8_9BACT|nr:YdeI/OmpD-associated family protein [Opitutaceae bacterium LMO-M01]WED64196.1 YdeI/OmpD-associated family protein [Opitutaceae bacterium LMO-M01]
MSRDPRIDTYIAHAQPFAQPILKHLRELVHQAVPEVVETIKWGAPAYTLKGKQVCLTASFKAHCALSFWAKAMEEVLAADGIGPQEGMGNLGKITDLTDLPARTKLIRYLQTAARLATAAPAGRPTAKTRKPTLATPPELASALQQPSHAAAAHTWTAFTPAKRREYIEWITTAKQDATRARRLATTLQWLAEGKTRHWKYQNC